MRAGIDFVLTANHLGDVTAGGDDNLAFRHDGVVAALERQFLAIHAVIGRYEMRSGALAREPGGPGGRAGTGVDEGYVFGADQGLQPGGVAPDREWILGQQRQSDVTPSGTLDGRDHASAGAGDERHGLGFGDRLGYFDGAAFHAAGDQRRQHLKHHGRPIGWFVHVHCFQIVSGDRFSDHGLAGTHFHCRTRMRIRRGRPRQKGHRAAGTTHDVRGDFEEVLLRVIHVHFEEALGRPVDPAWPCHVASRANEPTDGSDAGRLWRFDGAGSYEMCNAVRPLRSALRP